MLSFAKIYFLIFAAVNVVGGVMGYVSKGSGKSLVAGTIAGIVLAVSALLPLNQTKLAMALALFASLALAGRFTPLLLSGKMNPAAYVVPLSVIGALLAGWILFGAVSGK